MTARLAPGYGCSWGAKITNDPHKTTYVPVASRLSAAWIVPHSEDRASSGVQPIHLSQHICGILSPWSWTDGGQIVTTRRIRQNGDTGALHNELACVLPVSRRLQLGGGHICFLSSTAPRFQACRTGDAALRTRDPARGRSPQRHQAAVHRPKRHPRP